MKKRRKIVILDDEPLIVETLRCAIRAQLGIRSDDVVGFTKDGDATEFVIRNRELVIGYIQDVNRKPEGVFDRLDASGIKFYNQVIDCFTPWAKTIILSGTLSIDILVKLVMKGGERLRFISKHEIKMNEKLEEAISWLIKPLIEKKEELSESNSQIIHLLEPAWDKLCEYLTQHPEYLHQMDPHDFEILAGEIFRSYGWLVDFTLRTKDGGYDVIATRRSFPTDIRILVQAKRYSPNNPIGVDIVRSLYGVLGLRPASQVVLVTSSYVTLDAKKEFERVIPWELDFIERDKILEWCRAYGGARIDGRFER